MDCIKRFGVVIVLGLGLLAGCSKSESTATALRRQAMAYHHQGKRS